MTPETVLTRFALAFVASITFGLARQRLGKPIGFGTFTLVSLGSCALALIAISIPENPLPLLGATVTGIGFLGAGALFRTNDRVVGFTSSATIWIFAVLGLVIGVGSYLVAGLVLVAIWTVVSIDRWLENRWIGAHQRKLTVEVPLGTTDESLDALGLPERSSAQVVQLDFDARTLVLTYAISRPAAESFDVIDRLERSDIVRRATVESA